MKSWLRPSLNWLLVLAPISWVCDLALHQDLLTFLTAAGAIIPVIPFFFMRGGPAIATAAAVSIVAHFAVGAAKALVTLRKWWSSGLEMTALGVIVGAITYVVGLLFQVH